MITNQRPLSALKSEDTIEISSSSFVLSHYFKLFLWTSNALKSDETRTQFELVL